MVKARPHKKAVSRPAAKAKAAARAKAKPGAKAKRAAKAKPAAKAKTAAPSKTTAKPKPAAKTKKAATSKTTAKPKAAANTKAAANAKPAANAKAATQRPARTATAAAPGAPPSWHTWDDRPDELAVLDHVEAFAQALHAGDRARAFTLCPIYTYRDPLLAGAGDEAAVARTWQAIQDALVSWDYVDASDASWFTHVTPPSRVEYQQLNLALPEDQGDTLANVFVRDAVTDITSIFSLLEQDGRWQLAFKMFKVM